MKLSFRLTTAIAALACSILLTSSAQAQTHTQNSKFVDYLYSKLLGKSPDANTKAMVVSMLDAGIYSRQQVVSGLTSGSAYRQHAVNTDYEWYLRRAPSASESYYWVSGGGSQYNLRYIRAALLSSDEFYNLAQTMPTDLYIADLADYKYAKALVLATSVTTYGLDDEIQALYWQLQAKQMTRFQAAQFRLLTSGGVDRFNEDEMKIMDIFWGWADSLYTTANQLIILHGASDTEEINFLATSDRFFQRAQQ